MKTRRYILLAAAVLAVFFTGLLLGRGCSKKDQVIEKETKETIIDTILYHSPVQQKEIATGTRRYTIPTYYIIGGRIGEAQSKLADNDSICSDTLSTMRVVGASAGGKPRCSNDSTIVELPLIQRHYKDSTYEAWVSGPVDPRLDSVRVYSMNTMITKREWKPPKRWHIGITAGYGYGTKGFQPYIGVGITYSIFSF